MFGSIMGWCLADRTAIVSQLTSVPVRSDTGGQGRKGQTAQWTGGGQVWPRIWPTCYGMMEYLTRRGSRRFIRLVTEQKKAKVSSRRYTGRGTDNCLFCMRQERCWSRLRFHQTLIPLREMICCRTRTQAFFHFLPKTKIKVMQHVL